MTVRRPLAYNNGRVTELPTGDTITPASIADGSIEEQKLRDSAALSVMGRSANSAGTPDDIIASVDGYALVRSGTTVGFGQVSAAGLASDAVTTVKILDANVTAVKLASDAVTTVKILNANVTYAKIQDVSATARLLGRKTAGAGVIEELSASDVAALGIGATVPGVPGGRLTLSSGVPVMTSTVSGATTIYYTPYLHQFVPLYDGTDWKMFDVGGELSQTTSDSTKSPAAVVQYALYDLFLWVDSGTYRCTRGPAWTYSSVVTFTDAGDLVNWTAHGLTEGMEIVFTNVGGAVPTGLTAGTSYYVRRDPNTDSFVISSSLANAHSGTIQTFSSAGTGTTTATVRSKARGTGAGTSELERVKGVLVNKNSITNGPAAQRGTYVGTISANGSSAVDWIYAGLAAGMTAGVFNVWNMYNRLGVSTMGGDTTNSWTYTTATFHAANDSITARVTFVVGVAEEDVFSTYTAVGQNSSSGITKRCAVGLDSTLVKGPGSIGGIGAGAAGDTGPLTATFCAPVSIGRHFCAALEQSNASGVTTWFGDGGDPTLLQSGLAFKTRM